MQMEYNTAQMNEQVMFMSDAWKREQGIVTQIEKDLKFKDEQLERAQEANAGQGAVIADLDNQLKAIESANAILSLRTSQVRNKSAVDIKDLEMANKAAKTIDELELLLIQRTEELEQSMNDLSIFEQTV